LAGEDSTEKFDCDEERRERMTKLGFKLGATPLHFKLKLKFYLDRVSPQDIDVLAVKSLLRGTKLVFLYFFFNNILFIFREGLDEGLPPRAQSTWSSYIWNRLCSVYVFKI
jgi:hypothetical protein